MSVGGRGAKSVVMRIFENVFNDGNMNELDRVVDPEVARAPLGGSGPHATVAAVETLRRAFPDLRFEVDDLIAEDDRVAASWVMTGTHLGQFLTVAPTGRVVRVRGITVFELRRGKWRGASGSWDLPHALAQLGAPIPGMPGADPSG